jgi:hypothetical protein
LLPRSTDALLPHFKFSGSPLGLLALFNRKESSVLIRSGNKILNLDQFTVARLSTVKGKKRVLLFFSGLTKPEVVAGEAADDLWGELAERAAADSFGEAEED